LGNLAIRASRILRRFGFSSQKQQLVRFSTDLRGPDRVKEVYFKNAARAGLDRLTRLFLNHSQSPRLSACGAHLTIVVA
ncbi:hypothetical protein, partial [Escherichia coli]|uniref:hypothetical protein n=1 Tax=Escherichia coli TaxID=562 RepID=UPI001A7E07B0